MAITPGLREGHHPSLPLETPNAVYMSTESARDGTTEVAAPAQRRAVGESIGLDR